MIKELIIENFPLSYYLSLIYLAISIWFVLTWSLNEDGDGFKDRRSKINTAIAPVVFPIQLIQRLRGSIGQFIGMFIFAIVAYFFLIIGPRVS